MEINKNLQELEKLANEQKAVENKIKELSKKIYEKFTTENIDGRSVDIIFQFDWKTLRFILTTNTGYTSSSVKLSIESAKKLLKYLEKSLEGELT